MLSQDLDHYLKIWNLSDPQLLTKTNTSHIYTVLFEGKRVILKVLTAEGKEEKTGAVALRYFSGQGAVQLLREDEQAHLLEYADGEDLVGMVKSGADEQATGIIADVLNQLHSASNELYPEGLTPLPIWFGELFKKADLDRRAGINSLYTRAAPMAEALLADPYDARVLHGDIHHENIRYHRERGWLAFDPKGLVGERTFDAVNVLRNPMNMPALVENETRLLKQANILAQKMGLDMSRLLKFVFVYTALSASWFISDGGDADAEADVRIARLVEPHLQG
jgi:streptomycin 6-kinase